MEPKGRAYRLAHLKQYAAYARKWRAANKNKILANEPRRKAKLKTKWQDMKKEILMKYGNGRCKACGTTDPACLTLDHKFNNGNIERKAGSSGWAWQNSLMVEPKREDLQVLCMNCQFRKRAYGSKIDSWPKHVWEIVK